MLQLLLLLALGLNTLGVSLMAQTPSNVWQSIETSSIPEGGKRMIQPNHFTTYQLDQSLLQDILSTAPAEASTSVANSSAILPVPLPTGEMAQFRIVSYALFEPGLQDKYPSFRAFYGRGLDDPHQRIRLDWTDAGFRAVLRTQNGSVFIDPYAQGDTEHYLSYFKRDYPRPEQPFNCGTEAVEESKSEEESNLSSLAGDCAFRTYRMAIATTGEYSNYFGATSGAQSGIVLSEVMTSVNRVNDVYEIDFGIRLILIDNADDVFYYNPATDPYTNGNAGAMLGEVTPDLNTNIGTANYDIGHVYGTNSGGVANLRGVCGNNKARGVTGGNPPTNDPFWIDYVAHEVGHQFGGNHTQNNGCNRSGASYEPGSASTVMGYAGICSPNVQNNSDAYFHAINLFEVSNFVVNGNGGGCSTNIANPNTAPEVDAGDDYTIPRSTPYVLTAVGTDSDAGDPLTYCWEQYNNEVGEVMPPDPENEQGPMFRSLTPVASPQRYFPNLATVVANGQNTWEVLSDVTRTLDFRVTVRDNSTNLISCTDEDDMQITVTSVAGPFLVIVPSANNISWYENEAKTVSWDVANTDITPVNCGLVDILLSYDGGFTYPVTLATEVPNSGMAEVVAPPLNGGPETDVRIMVRCSDNVFYDISNNDFSILPEETTFTIEAAPGAAKICQGEETSFAVNTNAIAGYTGNISLSISPLPNGALAVLSNNLIMAGEDVTVSLIETAALPAGAYPLTITATDGTTTRTVAFTLNVEAAGVLVTQNSPAPDAVDLPTAPVFEWEAVAGVLSYQLQVSETADFSQIVIDTIVAENSFQSATSLDLSANYYWRVRTVLPCPGPYGQERSFTTGNCLTLVSSTTVDISPNGANLVYTSVLTSTRAETIEEISISGLQGTHTWMTDLDFVLIAPDGTRFNLFNDLCGNSDDFDLGLSDDAAESVVDAPCAPLGQGGVYRPVTSLSPLIGQSALGDWTLEITDDANQDGGQLVKWSLELCIDFDPLPVVWEDFNAVARTKDIELSWSTSAEIDNAFYVVERLDASGTDFFQIGTQSAATNARAGADYTFVDADVRPGLDYFYRIRQVDIDGSSSLSAVRQARIRSAGTDLSIFPNPVGDQLYVALAAPDADYNSYQVLDANGRIVMEQSNDFDVRQGINCHQLPQGVYALRLFADTGASVGGKFVVLPK